MTPIETKLALNNGEKKIAKRKHLSPDTMIPAMSNERLGILNKAYYYGEYDLKEYRELRAKIIDEVTCDAEPPKEKNSDAATSQSTLKLSANTAGNNNAQQRDDNHLASTPQQKKASAVSSADEDRSQRGPSAMQFLWVSIAIILFIYMYTATIE